MRIAITGATGLLGRNLLFEILKQNLRNLDPIEILVFGRPHRILSLEKRLETIILNDGFDYIGLNPIGSHDILNKINNSIIAIPFDLSEDNLILSKDSINKLINTKIDYFFHLASLSDFRMDSHTKNKLHNINVKGTNRVLKLLDKLYVKEAIYTGSAYSFGDNLCEINPDYINLKGSFRNYYEESKLIAELDFRYFCKNHNIRHRVIRPVGICGRLIENPIGSINKFHDLFYGWAAFFLRYKLNNNTDFENVYKEPLNLSIRIARNPNSALNIIPADYAAKMIYSLCVYNDKHESYHLANKTDISHDLYLSLIMKELNITGYKFVDKEPNDKNSIEKLYYKTVGNIYTPYLMMNKYRFNISNLSNISKKIGLSCPEINKESMRCLIKYAKDRFFGLGKMAY